MDGFIYKHRKTLDNPVVCKDTDYYTVWDYLLLSATHTGYDVTFRGKRITLKPGQLLTSRKSIANKWKLSESKVERILKAFEIEQQIEQQSSSQNRLITILQWNKYQNTEQQIKQRADSKRTTGKQRVDTNNNVDKYNKEIIPPYPIDEFCFSTELKEQVFLWLRYKAEKNEKYKPTGFKSFLKSVKMNADNFGEAAVISLIEESMANNWKGIVWDKIATPLKAKPEEKITWR